MKTFLISCLLLFFISIEAFPQTVSHPNIEWEEAGAVTDFPEWSEFDSVFYVPTPSQSNDHWQDIQNAIDAAGAASGTNLVSLYYGTYTIDKPLILEAGIHDNVYIKGAGPDHEMSPSPYFTTIEFDFSNPEDFDIPETYGDQNAGIGIIGGDAFNVGIIAGYNASNNSITIYTSNTVNVGDFLRIRSNYDTDNDILMGQMNRVKNILNNSPLVIELDHDFSLTWEQKTEYESEYGNFNLRAYKVNAIKNVGISSLSLKTIGYTSPNPNPDIIPAEDGSAYENSPHGYHIISFRSYNSVIENIHSFRPIASHIYMVETLQNTVEKSFFEDAIYRHGYAGGHGYGIKSFRKNTLNLIENNIFRHLRRSLMISRGDHKNVIGYNYSREVSSQSGDQDTRGDLSSRNWFDSGNLAEGNRVDRITNDIWHGDVYTQYKNVYFRNYTYYHELLNEGGIDTYFIGNQGKFKNTDFQSIHTDTYAFVNFYVYGHPTINELKHNDLTEDGYANPFVYLNMKSLYHDYKPDFMIINLIS